MQRTILDAHQGKTAPFPGYGLDTDPGTVLLAGEPFCELYLHYLAARIDWANLDYEGYNANIALFNRDYAAMEQDYHRRHRPKSGGRFRF